MIVRQLLSQQNDLAAPGVRPAWVVFLEIQKVPVAPFALVLQADHANLAGDLAAALRPDVFGRLTEEVTEAIRRHDDGWEGSDRMQLNALPGTIPRPFPLLPPQEALPCWNESIRRAEAISPLRGVMVSRHFCALAEQDPQHREFYEVETRRREKIEKDLGAAPEELARWTSAIGFCDILSLYLCSGSREPVELPLAHPALPDARNARKVFLEWVEDTPQFSSPIITGGTMVKVNGWQQGNPGMDIQRHTFSWTFAG